MKKILEVILLSSLSIFSQSLFAQGGDADLEGNEVLVTDIDPEIDPGTNGGAAMRCEAYRTASISRPGLFLRDGDFETFAGDARGTTGECVSTEPKETHAIATLQKSGCTTSLWKVSHGSPEIGVFGTSPNQNHVLHMWSGDWDGNGDFEGEGVFYDCPLIVCQNYQISLKLSSTGLIRKVHFVLATGLFHRVDNGSGNLFKPESTFYNKPRVNDFQSIVTLVDFNSGADNWVNVTLPTFSPNVDGMKLWIFTADDNNRIASGIDLLLIDDITDGVAGSSSTCSNSVTINASTLPALTRAATVTIQGSSVQTPAGLSEVIAGESISMYPNFHAVAGTEFHARIVPCADANNCPSAGRSSQIPDPVIGNEREIQDVVYPVPADQQLTIRLPEFEREPVEITMYDLNGRPVKKLSLNNCTREVQILTHDITSGLYIIQVKCAARTKVVKVSVRH